MIVGEVITMNGNTFYFEWEIALIEWLQSTLGSFGENVSTVLAHFGEEMILVYPINADDKGFCREYTKKVLEKL